MRSQCAWTVREMPQAGEQPKRQMHVTGAPPASIKSAAEAVLQGSLHSKDCLPRLLASIPSILKEGTAGRMAYWCDAQVTWQGSGDSQPVVTVD